jgi:phosphoribosylglycinamide formyltransferase-1
MSQKQINIAVLVSGQGTNLEALFERVHGREARIVAVASNVADAPALRRARGRDVPTKTFSRKRFATRVERDQAMAQWLKDEGVQLVVLAGFMELLSQAFLEEFPNAVINIHPSLLPAFPGLNAVERAIEAGCEDFGATVHLVDAGIDTGPIIAQGRVKITGARDPDAVLTAIRPIEHGLLCSVVKDFASRLHQQLEDEQILVAAA